MRTKEEIEKYIGTAQFDEGSGFIFGKQPDNTLNMVAEVRGWGAIQNMFKTQDEAQQFQDNICLFITDAINEKLNSKIAERIKIEFAIEILNKLSVDNGVVGFIENKITELKNEIK